jgi:predicted RNase H-like nuclease (RuvC/YqgF family)
MKPSAPIRLSSGLLLAAAAAAHAQQATSSIVYRCPGNVYTSNAELNAKQAEEKGCKVLEGSPVTVIQSNRPREARAPGAGQPVPSRPEAKVDPAEQRSRDSDARRILEAELRREEEKLAALQREYNGGEPERRGDERNYQRYLDRVSELKAGIARKESDIAALRRELAKLPPS